MTRLASTLLLGATIVGCADRPLGDGPDVATSSAESTASGVGDTGAPTTGGGEPGTPTSGSPTSEPPVTGGSSSGEPDPSAGGSSEDSGPGFLPAPDSGGGRQCDPIAQDCPMGQKCAPWSNDGGSSWNATKCVPVTGDQLPGEPCTTDGGPVSGNDDCVKGAMCWDVSPDNVGFCIAMCMGSSSDPVCEPGFQCTINGDGVLTICLPLCDLLAQDCPGDDLCLLLNDSSQCVLDASGDEGQAFDPCEFANVCDPGLLCAESTAASECDPEIAGCCTPMCSLSAMAACPGVGQECAPVFEEGQAPPELVDVGYCKVPA